ncbi:MAG: GntR family transcriptional regulator [Paracoccaceae bacterium]|nr:GntR family transcriptional regulator [Paracoccaceae bacterium]
MAETNRMSQAEKATISLRGLIMSGEYPAGSRLPEVALSERIGISRTPLRQAMDRLVTEGLLVRAASSGCRVARFDLDDINDAIELRGVIEGMAARLAAERGAEETLMAKAEAVLDAIDVALEPVSALDFTAYVRLNAEFHEMLGQLAGSPVIRREVDRITQLPLASPSSFLSDQLMGPEFAASLIRAQDHHRGILAAIAAREGSRAEALAREHARLAREKFDYLQHADPKLTRRVPGLALVTAE